MAIKRSRGALSSIARAAQGMVWVPIGHLALVSLAGALPSPRPCAGPPRHVFRILVFAHDEEEDVADCVASVLELSYPEGLRRVVVVADNCSDRTAERARTSGAEVWERVDPARAGKGPAIAWALSRLSGENDWDAVVLLDADGQVSPSFLSVMDRRLAEGALAVQGERRVTNADANVVSRLAEISTAAQCVLRPRGRARLGGAAKLVGNGIVLRRSVLEACPWRAEGLVEDVEYWLALLANGIRPAFEAGARVSDLMPTEVSAARVQRTRWDAGRTAVLRRHVVGAVRTSWRTRDLVLAEAIFSELVLPTLSVTGVLIAAAAGTRWVVDRTGTGPALAQSGVLLGHLLVALKVAKAPPATYAALALTPGVALWRVSVTVDALVRGKDRQWARTPRRAARSEARGSRSSGPLESM